MTDEVRIRERLKGAKLVVVKVGSSVLTNDTGGIRGSRIEAIAADISALKKRGIHALRGGLG